MLPYKFRLSSIENIDTAKQSPNPTGGSLNLMWSFFCEFLSELFEAVSTSLSVTQLLLGEMMKTLIEKEGTYSAILE
jgi:hypothetical protein